MSEAKITGKCQWCDGTGNEIDARDAEGNPIQRTCTRCGGDGKIDSTGTVDTTEIMEQLGAIRGKVEAIWNKVK